MQTAGASPEAVAFMRQLNNEAYLQKFQDTGHVGIAWVTYPFRANENSGCLLVNGTPSRVDVDNLSQLPRDRLNADRAWKALLNKHPHATLWSGDRSGATGVRAEPRSGGGQRFVVDYRVLDGCHACARLGVVRYAFNFDANGTFQGARYLDLREAGPRTEPPVVDPAANHASSNLPVGATLGSIQSISSVWVKRKTISIHQPVGADGSGNRE